MKNTTQFVKLMSLVTLCWFLGVVDLVYGETNSGDLAILKEFRDGLDNPELLEWPNSDDPCGERWKHVFCSESRVSQIQVQGLGLKGTLPPDLNKLTSLSNLGLQKNHFSGALPSFSGLTNLQKAYLDYNEFDSIPADFFDGLVNLQFLALDNNMFNASTGWMFTKGLQDSAQLTNLSCMSCNLAGPLPDFLGSLSSLQALRLSLNNLSGEIPVTYKGMALQILWLNDQNDGGLTGPIDVVTTMTSMNSLWLHGNQFTGTIPESIGGLTALEDLNVNGNKLVGLVPESLADMPLENLDLNNNQFMGPIPKFKATKALYASNPFCQSTAGVACAPEVMALIDFLGDLSYPPRLVSSWTGNDPCSQWVGLACVSNKVSSIILPNYTLSGNLSASIGKLDLLGVIQLQNNNLSGQIPGNWTSLASLKTLDLSGNNISPPVPKFGSTVHLSIEGNPLVSSGGTTSPSSGGTTSPSSGGTTSPSGPSPSNASTGTGSSNQPSSPSEGESSIQPSSNSSNVVVQKSAKKSTYVTILAPLASIAVLAILLVPLCIYCWKRKKETLEAPSSLVIHPRDPSDPDNTVKIAVASSTNCSHSTLNGSSSASINNSSVSGSHVIESGNLVISVQVLRKATKNFSPENELGRGGFGVVYKGELDDGTEIAVKRMETSVISNKALDEFQAEIGVLSKVRHRHLVSLLAFSVEGYERILVYEYMPQGALSKHLFHWKSFKLEPLSWKRRLNIALDVARGMQYLHNLAHKSFIHRDLKSSNILLDDNFRAKVSDFGLVKLAPDGEKSVVTRLAGTFGYLAPEYAVTGKITTKVDVFSFGVVLMELLTGLMALDEDRPEESRYLAAWFWRIRSDEEKLKAAIDVTLDLNDGTFESISTIAELAGHCTAREPGQRPDMNHAVNILAPLVDKWKPLDDEDEEYGGIDYSLPLNQMVKGWKESEGKDTSYASLEDSQGSIPTRPTGFADSFTSSDGR